MNNPKQIQSLDKMPEYLSTQHLIQLGLYPSIDAAYQARLNGYAPEYIKLRHKILYKKSAVISFLAERTKQGDSFSQQQASTTKEQ